MTLVLLASANFLRQPVPGTKMRLMIVLLPGYSMVVDIDIGTAKT